MKKILWTALAAALCGPAGAQTVMKIGTATINDVQHEYAKRFAERVTKQSGGKIKVEVYPAEQLGSNPRMIEGLSLGTVEGLVGPPEFMVGVDPRFQILGAPGLVKDMPHAVRLASDPKFRNALFSFGEAKGIKGVGLVMYGPNSYATRKPVRSVADFKGLKIRIFASPMHTLAMQHLGATGVPMIPSEALQAIASGAIDGNRTGMTLFVAFKYYDVVKYATQVEGDAFIFSEFAVGKAWFDKLPKDEQKLLLDTALAVEPGLNDFTTELNRKAEAAWKEHGAELIHITGADQAEFEKRMRSVGEEVVKQNPRIKEAYELMVERAKATAK
ncbi:MAG TPA: TRAP transporter substrate-binding protein [Burkholderiales bacterium]|jgi:TRAP-type C4-dicarboxylate transport system substrate-binding protein|nr:TRAP transporter substrate-binding protein [Burkholderiales bacterium]